jgi:CHAD domain-containing protein
MAKCNSEFTFTFFDIAYSLGGQRDVDVIYKSLSQIEQDYLSQKEKEVLSCMLITYANDKMFPSWTYLQQR